LIHVYGTSHVSQESIDLIHEKIEEHDPEIVALELDFTRLNGLLSDKEKRSGGPVFIRLIKAFQDMIGSKTGVMPGQEMLYAYNKAVDEERDVALIDQEISETVRNLKSTPRKEKVKAAAHLVVGALFSGNFDASEIPEDRFIDQLLAEFEFKFPELHRVLVEDRNRYMVKALEQLQEENPEGDIVAFVGAAHRKEIENELNPN